MSTHACIHIKNLHLHKTVQHKHNKSVWLEVSQLKLHFIRKLQIGIKGIALEQFLSPVGTVWSHTVAQVLHKFIGHNFPPSIFLWTNTKSSDWVQKVESHATALFCTVVSVWLWISNSETIVLLNQVCPNSVPEGHCPAEFSSTCLNTPAWKAQAKSFKRKPAKKKKKVCRERD